MQSHTLYSILLYTVLPLYALLLYVNSCKGGFVLDDKHSIVSNPQLRSEFPFTQLFTHDFW